MLDFILNVLMNGYVSTMVAWQSGLTAFPYIREVNPYIQNKTEEILSRWG